jgi:hypothetical protein
MPMVNGEKFPYTKKGKAMAKAKEKANKPGSKTKKMMMKKATKKK